MSQSIQSRFILSFAANILKSILSFATGLVIARSLGPKDYGDMVFLIGTFVSFQQLIDMGSSTTFFTFLSQRRQSKKFILWFFSWLFLQFILTIIIIGLVLPSEWINLIWKGEERWIVLIAFVATFMQSYVWSIVVQIGESERLTRMVQSVGVSVLILHAALVVIFWYFSSLSVSIIFIALIFEYSIAIFLVMKYLNFSKSGVVADNFEILFKDFRQYCFPLIPFAWIGFIYGFADRWLLQNYGGSIQQAQYAVAFQFSAISILATSSILNIFWKEIAEAHHQKNNDELAALYKKTSRGLFFLGAAISGFLIPWSEDILNLALGTSYIGGATTLAVMLLYPIHQSMGQIGGVMLYATGRVRAQSIIGMIFMTIGILITYFVLAPDTSPLPGLGLGSLGLAIKMVALQFLTVYVVTVYIAKSIHIDVDWKYQVMVGLICIGLGFLAQLIVVFVMGASFKALYGMFIAGFIYLTAIMIFFFCFPSLVGSNTSEIIGVFKRLCGWRINLSKK